MADKFNPLNYSRQIIKEFSDYRKIQNKSSENYGVLSHYIDLARKSQKFLLPEGGRLYDDPELRSLDETEELHLPFPVIALEYHRTNKNGLDETLSHSSKAVVFASEGLDRIIVSIACWMDHVKKWAPFPEIALPKTGYIDRKNVIGGRCSCNAITNNQSFPLSDYSDEVSALLCFLNILQCNNVKAEIRHQSTIRQSMNRGLPFDSYHILTISQTSASNEGSDTGGHRSPREHLRRGHIRRLGDGRKVWVNAAIVAAGRGSGVVTKDYKLRG